MSSLVISGDTSGTVTLDVPAVAGANTLTLPAVTDTLAPLVQGTAQASTSGTVVDFTGIPSWVKRITLTFSGVSTNGSAALLLRIGSGTFDTTGYLGTGSSIAAVVVSQNSTVGFVLNGAGAGAAETVHGLVTFALVNASTNTWSVFGGVGQSGAAQIYLTTGSKALSGVLDRVRVTTTNGTDTFDAGTINILYE